MGRFVRRTLTIGGVTLGALALLQRNPETRRVVRRAAHNVVKRARYLRGVAHGIWYRMRGGGPDREVSDDILTERVRSSLGRLEKERDLPRVHVMAEDHIVLLHGEVPTAEDRVAVEREVLDVPGVRAVESYLHIGLTRGTTRPSAGHAAQAQQPSDALRALLQASRDSGRDRGARRRIRARRARHVQRAHSRRRARTTALPSPPRCARPCRATATARAAVDTTHRSGIGRHRERTGRNEHAASEHGHRSGARASADPGARGSCRRRGGAAAGAAHAVDERRPR